MRQIEARTGRGNLRALALPLTMATAAGCFSPERSPALESTEGSTGTETTDESSSGTTASTNDGDGTTSTQADESTDDGDSESTGVPVEPRCGDGIPVAGELCFDDPPQTFTVGQGPVDVALGDLSGNGLADIVTLNHDAELISGSITILSADGLGGFLVDDNSGRRAPSRGSRIAILDGDGDGDNDIFASGRGGFTYYNNLNDFYGEYPTEWAAADWLVQDQRIHDFDGDGIVDLGTTQVGRHEFYRGVITNGRWSFAQDTGVRIHEWVGASGFVPIVLGFDADDVLDVVVLSESFSTVQLLRGLDGDRYEPIGDPIAACPGEYEGVRHGEAGDLDGDGDQDLVVTCMYGDISVLLADEDGFGEYTLRAFAGAFRPHLADLDGDGDLDVVVAAPELARVAVFVNDGTGTFTLHGRQFTTNGPTYGLAIHDLDRDGALDLIIPSNSGEAEGQLDIYYATP